MGLVCWLMGVWLSRCSSWAEGRTESRDTNEERDNYVSRLIA
jgi:hypothetical protein